MKKILVLLVLSAACMTNAQTVKQTKPIETKSNIELKQVIAEKNNGDRLTGKFVKADAESVTMQISGTDIKLPVTEIKAIWFGEVTNNSANSNSESSKNILVEAAVIYRSGQVVPVARTTFYLLDDNVVSILKNAGVNVPSIGSTSNQDYSKSIYMGLGFSARYGSLPEYQLFIQSYQEAIKPHIKYQFETDFSGKANLNDVPKGNFYLFSVASTRQSGVVWSMPVDTSSAKTLTLDQNNAVFAY